MWLNPLYSDLRIDSTSVCKQYPQWQVPFETLNRARGSDCPSGQFGVLLVTVIAPLSAFCCVVLIWLCWNRTSNNSISLQAACFPPMVAAEKAKDE